MGIERMFRKHITEIKDGQIEDGKDKILILSLKDMDEEQIVIQCGRQHVVILMLGPLKEIEKQRVIDFICGAAYVLSIQIVEIAKDAYLLAPEYVRLKEGIMPLDSRQEAAI